MNAASPAPPQLSAGMGQAVWAIALPAMVTNLATALFGLADMWAIGRIGDAGAQGAVELGAKFMMALLTVFNFLRTSTVALTAQGSGRRDSAGQAATLARAGAVALAIGALLLLSAPWTIPAGLSLFGAGEPVREGAQRYVAIRMWGSPAWLANCVLAGWLIGQRRVRSVLVAEVVANVAHIALDLALVLGLGWGVAGVASATVASEGLKLVLLGTMVLRAPPARAAGRAALTPETWHRHEIARLFALNRDLFLRTTLLNGAFLVFARVGARGGAEVLAANGILFQLFMLSALLLDGFESAAQVLCGEALGARNRPRFIAALAACLKGGALCSLVIAAGYALAGERLATGFTTDPATIATVAALAGWTIAMPLSGFASFVLDGVMVGAGWTRAMLVSMAAALALYGALLLALQPLGNAGLWIAFIAFFVARAAGQALLLPRLIARSFRPS